MNKNCRSSFVYWIPNLLNFQVTSKVCTQNPRLGCGGCSRPDAANPGLRTRRDGGRWGRGDRAGAGATCHHHVQVPQRDEDAGGATSAFHLVAGQILQLLIPLNSYRINGTVLSRKGNVFYAIAAPGRGATHATGTGCFFELAQS